MKFQALQIRDGTAQQVETEKESSREDDHDPPSFPLTKPRHFSRRDCIPVVSRCGRRSGNTNKANATAARKEHSQQPGNWPVVFCLLAVTHAAKGKAMFDV
eukprot:GHVT01026134.1.p1 GENE.GHVT01026134.1~~GHVT01026134.1.p1  ORF type:complete len:101 (+),score=15.45 GHVT01026134.1:189-491(+)